MTGERRSIINLKDFLPPSVSPDFRYGRVEIEGKYFYLAGRIPAEVRAPGWQERKKIASAIIISYNEVSELLRPLAKVLGVMPPRRLPLLPVYSEDDSSSARVGVATRLGLDSFNGRFSSLEAKFLEDALKETIKLSERRAVFSERGELERLVGEAANKRRDVLLFFVLGGFFACVLGWEEEVGISPHSGLVVASFSKISADFGHIPSRLPGRLTELFLLYFLLRAKQLGEDRVRILSPAQFVALLNYQGLLTLRRFTLRVVGEEKGWWAISHPRPIEEIFEKGERTGDTLWSIKIPPFGLLEKRNEGKSKGRFLFSRKKWYQKRA